MAVDDNEKGLRIGRNTCRKGVCSICFYRCPLYLFLSLKVFKLEPEYSGVTKIVIKSLAH